MINTKNKNQMEQIMQVVQGLSITQCVGLLASGFDILTITLEFSHRMAMPQGNTIVFCTGIESQLNKHGIKALCNTVRINLTEEEIKKYREELELPEDAYVPKAIAIYLQDDVSGGELDSYFSKFENVERNYSVLTDDDMVYPQFAA